MGTKNQMGNNVANAMFSLYTADDVYFNVPLTVIAKESVDVLAKYLGKGPAVMALTKQQVMKGATKFKMPSNT